MFGIGLLVAVTLMQAYVFVRAASVPIVARRVSRGVLVGVAAALWSLFVLARFVGHDGSGPFPAALELAGMDWMALLFLASVCLLATDVMTGFGFLVPRLAPRLRGWALLAGVGLSAFAVVQALRPPAVRSYEVPMAGLPQEADGTVVVALSDLHLGTLIGERWLAARVEQVEAQKPDLVVLLGDLVEGHGRPAGDFLAGFRRLSAPLGVWAVTGNHESHGSGAVNLKALGEAGVTVLHDRWVEVRPGLVLAGVDDLTSRHRSGKEGASIRKALDGRPPGATLLLSHTPWQAEVAAREGAELMLCGHTHGGQIWPFNYLVALSYPMVGGRYEVAGMTVLVSRGAGTWGPRMRLWRRGEILRVTLRRAGGVTGSSIRY